MNEPASALDLPQVIGHRGAAAAAPENTLAALRKASELGAAWVEFDVKLTADEQPILMHDERLERTTDGRGPVRAASLEQVLTLDAGAWFAPVFAGERVPTLEQALALCAELGLGINVEIKPCPGRAEATARRTVETLRARWPAGAPLPLISSFTPACLAVAQELAPDVPRGLLVERIPPDWRGLLQRYDCATLHAGQRGLDAREVAAFAEAGVPLLLYTVNDGRRARALLEAGAAAVFTDRVQEVLAALG